MQETWIESRSRPGHRYRMVLTPVSGWVHADDTCPAFTECWHRKAAEEQMTSLTIREEKGITERPALLVEYDAQALSRGVSPEIAAKWAYDLPSTDGSRQQGVGIRGVEEGVRLLAGRGEIIRVTDCHLERETEREAFFVARATRYLRLPDMEREIELDSQIAAKRVPKYAPRADQRGEYFVAAWYEIGYAKAARNAALKLMPSNVKSAILRAGLDAAATVKSGGRQAPAQRRQAPAHEEPQQVQSGSAGTVEPAASSPDKAPTKVAEYREYVLAAMRQHGFDDEAIKTACRDGYSGREPQDLSHKELQAFAAGLAVTVALPGQAVQAALGPA